MTLPPPRKSKQATRRECGNRRARPQPRRVQRALPPGRMSAEVRNELIPGPIWPWLARFTPTGEAGNEATVASFGTPFIRTRWVSMTSLWPWLASLRVARSGETFNSVPFCSISFHSLSSTRGKAARFRTSHERRRRFVRTTHATNVKAGAAMAQRAFVVNVGRGVAPPYAPPRLTPPTHRTVQAGIGNRTDEPYDSAYAKKR